MQNWGIIAASVIAILLILVSLAVLDARMLPAAPWVHSVSLSIASAAAGSLAWLVLAPILVPAVLGTLYIPVAALAGVAAYLATVAVRAHGGGTASTILFALLWSLVVFVPTAILTFAPLVTDWPADLEPVDHGGSLAVNVASGAAALGVLLAGGRRLRTALIRKSTGLVAVVGLSIGWLAWLVGAELAFDEVSLSILVNGLVGAVGGVVGWLSVQRISHQSTTLNAVAAGLVSGLVAVTAGAPLFTPVSAAVAGVLAGGAACIFTLRRVSSSRRQQWFVVGSHLVAGAVGIVTLGLLATSMGFLFTGSITLIQNQILAVLLVAAWSTGVSFLLWSVVRRFSRSVRSASSGSAR